MSNHTPEPWDWRNVVGAGIQIFGTLPKGFLIDAVYQWENGAETAHG
jgi:hypothetical protein